MKTAITLTAPAGLAGVAGSTDFLTASMDRDRPLRSAVIFVKHNGPRGSFSASVNYVTFRAGGLGNTVEPEPAPEG